jgi:hypothetical protein
MLAEMRSSTKEKRSREFELSPKNFVHIFSARSSFSFLPHVSRVIALLFYAGM